MTPEQFVYWLQGYLELAESQQLTSRQVKVIKEHLALVLKNVTDNGGKKRFQKAIEQLGVRTPRGDLKLC